MIIKNEKIKRILAIVLIMALCVLPYNYVNATDDENMLYTSLLSSNGTEKTDEGNLTYASGVTNEMCKPEYWSNKIKDAGKVIMMPEEISRLNEDIINGEGTNVVDLTKFEETKTLNERAEQLARAEIPTRDLYINGEKIDNTTYFTKLKNAIAETGFSGEEKTQYYAVATKRADIKDWPIDDIIGYNATDPDDEMESSTLNVNEPFIIGAKCVIDGKTFYWGNSNLCPGWINGDSLAICADKQEWLDAWQVDINEKDFLVVTQDVITLEPSISTPQTSEVKLMLGTALKLVPKDKMPGNIGERGTWNNYVVYLPTRDENGNYKREMALISQHYDVSIGFLPMTQENILNVAFSCLGNRYGWGGMLGAMDCSLYTRAIYECFGLELPRNTSWQQKVPGKVTDLSAMTDEEKEKYIEKLHAGAILLFPGHAMVYTGTENDVNYAISATGSLSDSVGEVEIKSMYSVILNPLTVRRRNEATWLTNLTSALSFSTIEEGTASDDQNKNEKDTNQATNDPTASEEPQQTETTPTNEQSSAETPTTNEQTNTETQPTSETTNTETQPTSETTNTEIQPTNKSTGLTQSTSEATSRSVANTTSTTDSDTTSGKMEVYSEIDEYELKEMDEQEKPISKTETPEKTPAAVVNPKTGDKIVSYIVLLGISIVGIIATRFLKN